MVMGHMTAEEVVYRARNGSREAVRDRKMLWWIGRFRYTSVELLSMRFGVAAQNVRVRLKRLEAARLVRLGRRSVNEPWIVSLTGAGARAIGEMPRRAPRTELHQAHELAIGWLCAYIETRQTNAGTVVLTEREMRSLERERRRMDEPPRYRLALDGAPRGQRSRWPDLVLSREGELVSAVEIEFTQKADERLERIIDAYMCSDFPKVVYLTADPCVAHKLVAVIESQRPGLLGINDRVEFVVAPWLRADETTRARVRAAIDAAR
jgi:DNA-binding MarR family transcriptional regulator